MRLFDRIREWARASDEDKVAMDRRAFLKGMAVTSAGLLVPGATVFDMGGVVKPLSFAPVHSLLVTPDIHFAQLPQLQDPARFAGLAYPLRRRVFAGLVAGDLIQVEKLPEGKLPIYT